jgi:hypothetical protein
MLRPSLMTAPIIAFAITFPHVRDHADRQSPVFSLPITKTEKYLF